MNSPAPFEQLREYIDQSVEQLLIDMRDQSVAYAVPADDVLALVKAVAKTERRHPLLTLRSWALRHAFPVNWIVDDVDVSGELPPDKRAALRKRLRDLLGYVVLALVLTEEERA